jgi:hypothetical protein
MSHELDVISRMVDYHDHISVPPVPIVDDLRRGRRRVRRNRGLVAGGVALGVVSVVAGAVLFTGDGSSDRPQPAGPPATSTTSGPGLDDSGLTAPMIAPKSLLDVRELGFRVEPGPDVVVTDSWGIDHDGQSTNVKVFGDGVTDLFVAVYYQGRSPDLPSMGTSEAITVHGVAGTYAEETRVDEDFWVGRLTWEYAPNSWALVSGRGTGTPPSDLRDKVVTAAEAVRSGGPTMRVPVRFGTVPASLPSVATAHDVSVSFDHGEWLWWLSVDDISVWATSRVGGECLGSEGQPQTDEFTYRGFPGCDVAGERIGLHLGNADVFFDYGPSPELPKEDMKRMLSELTVASDDPTTWFDLKTALGG